MTTTITIEIPADSEVLVRRLLALHEELQELARTAPDGSVFDACESAVVGKGRDLQTQLLSEAVARRVESAEKRGRESGSVAAAGPRRTAVPRPGNSPVPSASSP